MEIQIYFMNAFLKFLGFFFNLKSDEYLNYLLNFYSISCI